MSPNTKGTEQIKDEANKRFVRIKLVIFILVLVSFFILIRYTFLSNYANLETIKNSRDNLRVLSFNWWFPIAYVGVYVIGVAISFPALILTVSGGMIFGTVEGTILNVISSNIGASIDFFISRYLVRDFVKNLVNDKLNSIENKIEQNGFLTVLRLRLIPIVPFNLLNYVSGFSKIKYRDYVLGSMIGMLPGTFIYTFLADSIIIDPTKQKEAFFKLLIAALLLVTMSFIPTFFKNKSN